MLSSNDEVIVFIGDKSYGSSEEISSLNVAGQRFLFVEKFVDLFSCGLKLQIRVLVFQGIINFLRSLEYLGCNLTIDEDIPLLIVDDYRQGKSVMKHLGYMFKGNKLLFCRPDEFCHVLETLNDKFKTAI